MQSSNGSTGTNNAPSASSSGVDIGVTAPPLIYEFQGFRLDPANRLLTCAGKEVALPGRAFDALHMLVRRPGELVTKEELMAHIWSTSFVEESNLTVAISTLRRALNEDPQDRRFIQTVARRGYRFVAEVRAEEAVRPAAARMVAAERPTPGSVLPAPEADLSDSPAPALAERPRNTSPSRFNMRLLLALAAVAGVALASAWWLLRPREPVRTLAILPFRFSSGIDANDEGSYKLLGMTEALNESLARQVVVRPTSSVLRYASVGRCADTSGAMDAGREQGVDAVLTGIVDPLSKPAVVHLCLLRVRNGRTIWRDDIPDTPNSPETTQSALNIAVAAELHRLGSIPPPEAHAAPVPLNAPAYQLYLRGRYFWNRRTVDGLRKSVDYFRQSVDADPNYAPAYAGLADSYALLASFSVEPGRSANADARSAAFSAIHLDPTLAEPHASLGMIYFFTDWNLSAAEVEFERAIQLNPNYATAHHWYALDLAAMGRFPQALYEIRLAQKLDPLSLIIGTNVGWVEYLARDYPAATRDLGRVLELDPHFARARTRLGMVEMARGDYAAGARDLTEALALSANPQAGDAHPASPDPYVEGLLGDAEARAGNTAAAERTLADLRKRTGYVPPISRGLVLLGLDRKAEALTEFSRSVDDHSTSMVYARVDPLLDPLRKDPAFQALLSRTRP